MKEKLKRLIPYWPYALLAAVILGPLWLPGYVLTMDMVFVPHVPIPSEVNASFPLYVMLHYLSDAVPGDILQKLLLFGTFLLAGVGMDRLLRQLFGVKISRLAVVAAGIFYMTSAFVYERLMMGQWAVIAGYALLPFVAVSLLRLVARPTWRQTWRLSAWIMALVIVSIHTLVPAAIVGLAIGVMHYRRVRKFAGKLAVGLLTVLVASSYWLIPALLGDNTIGAAIRGSGDGAAFQTHGGLFALFRLQGMWAEGHDLFSLPQDIVPLPGIWQTLAWLGMIVGLVALWRRSRRLAIVCVALVAISCLVALVGLGDSYREPQKIMALAALVMGILLAAGIDAWLRWIRRKWPAFRLAAGFFACLVTIMLGAALLWGCLGQLSARQYPSEWYTLDRRLQRLPDDKSAVFVPWHLYQRYSFSPRIVASPAASFFTGRRIVTSNDPEFAGVQPLESDVLTTKVGQLLSERPSDLAARLAGLGVGYIIAAREPGYEQDAYLAHTSGLRQLFHEGRLTLYRVEAAK